MHVYATWKYVCMHVTLYLLRNLVTDNVTCSGTEPDSGEGAERTEPDSGEGEERVSITRNDADEDDQEIFGLSGKQENLLNPFVIYGGVD